jgi:hypothetical protein
MRLGFDGGAESQNLSAEPAEIPALRNEVLASWEDFFRIDESSARLAGEPHAGFGDGGYCNTPAFLKSPALT